MRQNRSRRARAASALCTLSCVITVIVSTFFTRGLEAQSTTAQECCLTLLFPYGARAVSLGQALTARTSIDGVFFNPASIANFGKTEMMIHYAQTLEEEGFNFALTFAKDVGVAGTFALTWVLVDQGTVDETDDNGNVIGQLSAREQAVHLTFATNVARGLRGGITATLYHRSVDVSATTLLLNGGIQYRVPRIRGLELGAALMHAGLALQVINERQKDPTPTRFRVGAAYELGHVLTRDSAVTFWLSADMVARLRNFGALSAPADSLSGRGSGWAPAFNVGAELGFDQAIFVRGGYAMSGDNLAEGGGGMGIGIRYDRFTIAVGKTFGTTPLQPEGEPFQISFGIAF